MKSAKRSINNSNTDPKHPIIKKTWAQSFFNKKFLKSLKSKIYTNFKIRSVVESDSYIDPYKSALYS